MTAIEHLLNNPPNQEHIMSENHHKMETKLIHAGEPKPRVNGAVSLPIFQSSTFEYTAGSKYHDLKYIRLNNIQITQPCMKNWLQWRMQKPPWSQPAVWQPFPPLFSLSFLREIISLYRTIYTVEPTVSLTMT